MSKEYLIVVSGQFDVMDQIDATLIRQARKDAGQYGRVMVLLDQDVGCMRSYDDRKNTLTKMGLVDWVEPSRGKTEKDEEFIVKPYRESYNINYLRREDVKEERYD